VVTALVERSLNLFHGPMRRCFGFAARHLSWRRAPLAAPSQPADQMISRDIVGWDLPPARACREDDVVAVRRHRMLYDIPKPYLSRFPLRLGRRLLGRGFFRRLLACDRHQHFLLPDGRLARLLS